MITPRFSLTQTEKTVTINIRAPYCSLSELDVNVEENVFLFCCAPYYLRLHLPGHLEDNDKRKSSYDTDNGQFTFTYEKATVGEHFEDLHMITKLMCPKLEVTDNGQKIEVLSSDTPLETVDCDGEFGFAMRGPQKFNNISSEFKEVFDIDPLEVTLEDRRLVRLGNEKQKFSIDHYIADLMEGDEITDLKKLESPWKNLTAQNIVFDEKELDFLKDLPNLTYDLNPTQVDYALHGLLDILFAYCYDRRTTYFEGTCESAWTISKISATLSCFDGFLTAKDAVISAFRRSLIYPLYRDFNLCLQLLEDLKMLLQLGDVFIVKCLHNVYEIFSSGDGRFYIFNNLFIKDYIIYAMKWDKEKWLLKIKEVQELQIRKEDLGLNLLQIEADHCCGDFLTDKLKSLRVDCDSDDSSYSDGSGSDSTTEDGSSSSDSEE